MEQVEQQEKEREGEVATGEQKKEGWSAAEAETTADEAERVRGSFLGLAWGDVFGCPVEGWRAGAIRQDQARNARP
jgi:hypothetical protein